MYELAPRQAGRQAEEEGVGLMWEDTELIITLIHKKKGPVKPQLLSATEPGGRCSGQVGMKHCGQGICMRKEL